MPADTHPVLNENRVNYMGTLLLLLTVVVHLCRFFADRRVASTMIDIVYGFFFTLDI